MFHLLPAAGFGLSKVGLGKVGLVESLGKPEPALVEDLGKICFNEMRRVIYNTYIMIKNWSNQKDCLHVS